MAKMNEIQLATGADGTEEIIVLQGSPGARQARRMSAADFAQAGTRPTQAEIVEAVLISLVGSENVALEAVGDGTVKITLKPSPAFTGNPTADTPAANDNSQRLATTAFVALVEAELNDAIAARQAPLVEGNGIELVDNGDGTVTLNASALAADDPLPDGLHGDVEVSTVGGAKVLALKTGTAVDLTIPDAAYSAAFNGSLRPVTRNAFYAKAEALAGLIGGKVSSSAVGAANGVASLDATGKVPAAQLPSYVDDVLEYNSLGVFPASGEAGKIYVAADTNKQYRWSGSAYVELIASPGTTDNVLEGSNNKYFTTARVLATLLAGLAETSGAPVAADTLLVALGKLTKQAFTTIPGAYAPLAAAENDFGGGAAFATPNSGTAGGLRLKANATSGFAYFQVMNAAKTVQWGAWRYNSTGEAYWTGNILAQGDIASASDRRLKKRIRRLTGARELVAKLKAYRFTMNGRPSVGVIAQEVEEVLPELVTLSADGFLGVDYGKLAALLIDDNNELARRLEEAQSAAEQAVESAELTARELVRQSGELEALKAAVAKLEAAA